jgi:major membrane immunogen (membrane-anchored lipoprotein)
MTRQALVAVAAVLTTACGGSNVEPQTGAQPGAIPPAGQTIVVVTAPTETASVAPSTPGTYHVMAVSQADPTKTAQVTITVGNEKVCPSR